MLELLDRNGVAVHMSFTLLLAFDVLNIVLGVIRPGVDSTAVLLAIFPGALVLLPVWIVDDTASAAIVIFELTFVDLAVRPHVGSLTGLFAEMEVSEIEPTVGPLEQSLALHDIVQERSLVDFTSRSDSSSEAVDLTFLKEAFEDGVIRVHFEAKSIWFECIKSDLTTVLGSAASLLKLALHHALRVHIIVNIVVLIVIKGAQHFVDVTHRLVSDSFHHILIVIQGELVVEPNDVTVQALF